MQLVVSVGRPVGCVQEYLGIKALYAAMQLSMMSCGCIRASTM